MPSQGIPQSFGLVIMFGMLIAGVFALVGFAIVKGADRHELGGRVEANEATAALWSSGDHCIEEGQEADPSLELVERLPLTCEAAAPLPIEEIDQEALTAGASPSRGAELFIANGCQVCHGDTAEGIVGPTIAQTGLDIHGVLTQYRQPRGVMPEQEPEDVPPEDIADIWSWLQTLPLPDELIDPDNNALGHENIGQFASN